MSDKLKDLNGQILRTFRSPRFFYVIAGLLFLQAGWIALSARYPQAFDEQFHFGLIKLHAQQWLPYFDHQPDGISTYGAIARDPSYLFHYLLSLPYRVISLFTASEALHIVILRFLNILLFISGLFVYRRLFDELKISKGLRNLTLFIFVLLPVSPLLAAQINYDNLILPLTGLLFLYLGRYIQQMRGRGPSAPLVPLLPALQVCVVGALGCIVKYAFLPIFLASVLVLVAAAGFYYYLARLRPKSLHTFIDWSGGRKLWFAVFLGLIVFGLWFERYGINIIWYHHPVPPCDAVLSTDACQAYSPWARDFLFANTYPHPPWFGYAVYPFVWIWRMVYETMFTITSRTFYPWEQVFYYAYSPLRIAFATAGLAIAGGLTGILLCWQRIRRNRPLFVLLGIIVFYGIVLFLQNFGMYRHTGEAVAIHGRYLIPVYPVLLLALVIGWHGLLSRIQLNHYRTVVLVAMTILFLQGGGITTWLVRSNDTWYWEHSTAAQRANAAVKTIVDKAVYHQKVSPEN